MKHQSVFAKEMNPKIIALGILGFMALVHLTIKIYDASHDDFDKINYWIVSATFLLFFTLFNSIFGFTSNDFSKHWANSIVGFVLVAGMGIGMAWLLSGMSIGETRLFKWLYVVLTIIFLVFQSILGMIKKLIQILNRENERNKL